MSLSPLPLLRRLCGLHRTPSLGSDPVSPCDTNTCIEVACDPTLADVRIWSTFTGDSMEATREEWDAFVARVKAGEFDPVPDGA